MTEGWFADPFYRHEMRYFSDGLPTPHVADGGVTAADPWPPRDPRPALDGLRWADSALPAPARLRLRSGVEAPSTAQWLAQPEVFSVAVARRHGRRRRRRERRPARVRLEPESLPDLA